MTDIRLQKILVTLDGSEVAESVLPYIRSLAPSFGSHIYAMGSAMGKKDRRVNRLLEDYINRIASSLREEGLKADPVVLYGSAVDKILDHADKNNIDLIVMATHGRSGISRWWIGSVAEKVISATKTPMLLVPARKADKIKAASKQAISKIVVPLDGSDTGQAALPYAEILARELGASINLIQIIPSPGTMDPSMPGGSYWIKFVEAVSDTAKYYLAGIAEKLSNQGIRITYEVITGDPAYKIAEYAEQAKSSLIAMSTHGRTGIARWVLGSVTDKVLHSSKVPILIVRPPKMVISEPKS